MDGVAGTHGPCICMALLEQQAYGSKAREEPIPFSSAYVSHGRGRDQVVVIRFLDIRANILVAMIVLVNKFGSG